MKRFFWICAWIALVTPQPARAQETASSVLPLEAVLLELVERNPELKAARAAVAASKERIPQAQAFDDPEFGLMQWSIPPNGDWFRANETWYSLSQRFPFFGKREKRGRIAALDLRMSEESLHGLERRIVAQAKMAYYDLFLARETIEIHHEQVALSQRFAAAAAEQFSTGAAGQQDVLRAQMEMLDLSNTIESLLQFQEEAAGRVNRLLDRPLDAPLGLTEVPSIPEHPPTLDRLQAAAERSRPEHRAEALAIEQNDETIALAKTAFLPDFMAEVSYWDVHGGENRWMTSFRINLPWLNKATHEARIREAVAERRRAESSYRAAVNETRFQVQSLYIAFEASRRLARLYEDGLLPLAEQAQEAALIGYATRKNDFLTLIDTQKRLREMRLAYLSALVALNKNLAELELLSGEPY